MSTGLAARWSSEVFKTIEEDRAASDDLKAAALAADLARWTSVLTSIVVRTFEALGYAAAAKGRRAVSLPVRRNEYLGQDVMAFANGTTGWRFPVAVCELENSAGDHPVAYSLWKVLCVRCALRVVFCYRADPKVAVTLIRALTASVIDVLPIAERATISGETLVVIGSRNETATFPYGFFQMWKLSVNTGRFDRFSRT